MTDQPFDENNLESPEYRERLMGKLNALIAVLQVATAKVRKSLGGPAPDTERLTKIQVNLTNTLEVCQRARRALERREALPEGLPENLTAVIRVSSTSELPPGANTEMSSLEEKARFEKLGRISKNDLQSVNMEDLERKLQLGQ
ncbi:MAG: hypothetical protein OSB42_07245 [Planctomycetota bacterium]|nr:hypothetical protein [Planctomycetota bacterium]